MNRNEYIAILGQLYRREANYIVWYGDGKKYNGIAPLLIEYMTCSLISNNMDVFNYLRKNGYIKVNSNGNVEHWGISQKGEAEYEVYRQKER